MQQATSREGAAMHWVGLLMADRRVKQTQDLVTLDSVTRRFYSFLTVTLLLLFNQVVL